MNENATKRAFDDALKAMRNGKRVCRLGWNGKGLFVFLMNPATIPFKAIQSMTSLPDPVKEELSKRGEPLFYSNQMVIVSESNKINGWVPSSSDLMAEDWVILD